MRKALQVEELAPLRKTVEKQSAEKSKTLAPAGLIWKNNSCFIHAPLYHLLEEPTIADDLAKAANYDDGENNPLFNVVKRYRECQISNEPFDAASMLRDANATYYLDDSGAFQDALDDGFNAFRSFFVDDLSQSPRLAYLLLNPVMLKIGTDIDPPPSLNTLVEEVLANKKSADVFSIQVQDRRALPERESQVTLSEGLSEEALPREEFLRALMQKIAPSLEFTDEDNEWLADLGIDNSDQLHFANHTQLSILLANVRENSLKTKLRAHYLRDQIVALGCENWDNLCSHFVDESIEFPSDEIAEQTQASLKDFANGILDDPESLGESLSLLSDDNPQKQAINDYRAEHFSNSADHLNPQSVEIDPSGQLTIQGEAYDISSFTAYLPGHFITYTQKDGVYYKLDDYSKTNKVEVISKEKFLEAAKTAYFYTVRKASLTPKPGFADAAQAQKEKEAALEPNEVVEDIPIGGTAFKLIVEKGSVKGAGNSFTLTNPTTDDFEDLHGQLKADKVMSESQFKTNIKTRKTRESRFYDVLTRPYKARGKHKLDTAPRSLVIHTPDKRRLLSTPLPPLTNEADVAQAITDTLDAAKERNITEIALPVFEYDGENIVEVMKEGIKAYLQKDSNQDWANKGGQIKIIQPRDSAAAGAA
jgi:hypothetical protein